MKATMLVAGGVSGGISSSIAGGSFWKGVRQGLITAGLNHVAHLGVTKLEENNFFKKKINEHYQDNKAADQSVKEDYLNVLKEIFSDLFVETSKDFAVANETNLKAYNGATGDNYGLEGKRIVNKDNGRGANGITSMKDGRVLIAPARMRTALGFTKTWYHEAIHSMHVVSGAFSYWSLSYGHSEAMRITEFFAHSVTDSLSGIDIKSSKAFTEYFPNAFLFNSLFIR